MSKPHLVACPSCARHVRVSEAACPFCGVVLADSLRSSAPPEPPGIRLARAALFALGTGTLALAPGARGTSIEGCSSTGVALPPYGIGPVPDDGGDDGGMTAVPHYGIAPVPDAGEDDGGVRALPPYGIAPVPDAGHPVPDAGADDGGHDAGMTAIPLYGIAPVPDAGQHDGGVHIVPPYGAPGFGPGASE